MKNLSSTIRLQRYQITFKMAFFAFHSIAGFTSNGIVQYHLYQIIYIYMNCEQWNSSKCNVQRNPNQLFNALSCYLYVYVYMNDSVEGLVHALRSWNELNAVKSKYLCIDPTYINTILYKSTASASNLIASVLYNNENVTWLLFSSALQYNYWG